MKHLFTCFAFVTLLFATGCSKEYDDSALTGRVNDLEGRVAQLEQLCKQMNTNISSLRTLVEAVQQNDYVKSVIPVTEGGKTIGYTITFTKSAPITIYHGKDGEKGDTGAAGAAGHDGHTPVIGVKQDTDGIYYWTLDGEWLTDGGAKIKAQGTDGQDGEDGEDGKPGTPGADGDKGQDGKDGITPKLKIENGYWFISYDNESSWTRLGKATGEDGADGAPGQDGKPGADGQDGDPMFADVDYTSSNDYVLFTLLGGTQIKLPTWSAFEALKTLCNEMNTNISSLHTIVTALQNNDYVTAVMPVMQEGKEIGYTITFSKSRPITIYHGKDGTNGKDGSTPVIGVKQDTDGTYYWTLNSEWLTDDAGAKIKAQGTDGQDGTNGKDGATPKLKIENGYWYISYDNEGSWTQLGKATGEDGKPGADGKDGDPMFQSVTQDEYNVYFTLTGGEKITLPKNQPLAITFSQQTDIPIRTNQLVTINYTLIGSDPNTVVDAIPINGWNVVVTATTISNGTITVTCSDTDISQKIVIFVSDRKGRTIMATLTFVLVDANNVITYKSDDNSIITPYNTSAFGVNIISNTYKNGFGILRFNGNVASIGVEAFKGCEKLTEITIPKNTVDIGTQAFYGCKKLRSVYLPDGVQTIGNDTFSACVELADIKIPESVNSIGIGCFQECSKLMTINIPQNIVDIKDATFQHCRFVSFTIPQNIQSIGSYALSFNGLLNVLYCKPQIPPQINSTTFAEGFAEGGVIYVPMESVDSYKSAYGWKQYSSQIIGYNF